MMITRPTAPAPALRQPRRRRQARARLQQQVQRAVERVQDPQPQQRVRDVGDHGREEHRRSLGADPAHSPMHQQARGRARSPPERHRDHDVERASCAVTPGTPHRRSSSRKLSRPEEARRLEQIPLEHRHHERHERRAPPRARAPRPGTARPSATGPAAPGRWRAPSSASRSPGEQVASSGRVIATHQLAAPHHRRRLVVRLFEQRVHDVLDLGPRLDVRHRLDERDVVQEDLRARRAQRVGSRNASDSATARSDGTVRPVAAAICWPSVPSANSRNAPRLRPCRSLARRSCSRRRSAGPWPAAWCTGSGATSHSKSVDRAERRHDLARLHHHRRASPRGIALSKSADSASSSVGVTPATRPQVEEGLDRLDRASRLAEREARRLGLGRRRASPPLDQMNGASRMISASAPSPYCVDRAVAVGVPVSSVAAWTMSIQLQPRFRVGSTPASSNRFSVVVDDQARDVLRHARLHAVVLERRHRLGVEVLGREDLGRLRGRRRPAPARPSPRTARR